MGTYRLSSPRFYFELDNLNTNVYDLVEFQYIDMSKGEHKSEKFLKINPMGDVPALVENDETMIESGAILLHLAERHQSDVDLIPHDEKQYLQWMVFVNSSCKFLSD